MAQTFDIQFNQRLVNKLGDLEMSNMALTLQLEMVSAQLADAQAQIIQLTPPAPAEVDSAAKSAPDMPVVAGAK